MKKTIVLGVILVLAFSFGHAFAQELSQKVSASGQSFLERLNPESMVVPDFDLRSEIEKAEQLLADKTTGKYSVVTKEKIECKKIKKNRCAKKIRKKKVELDKFNVILTVEHVQKRQIEFVHFAPNGDKKAVSGKFTIFWERVNGIATPYRVADPPGYIVLKLKRPIRAGKGFTERAYTPATPEIDTPEMRYAALAYLENLVLHAQDFLLRAEVRSIAYGGLLVNVMPVDVVKLVTTIWINEHMDHSRFLATVKNGKPDPEEVAKLVNEVLITIATNEEDAYLYARSGADALGLPQFIRGTYVEMFKYARAELIPDFVKGMADHRNCARASLLLFDSDLDKLKRFAPGLWKKLNNSQWEMTRYLAAAWNGGAKRAAPAMEKWGADWEKHLKPETQIFLQKFDAVWNLLYGDTTYATNL